MTIEPTNKIDNLSARLHGVVMRVQWLWRNWPIHNLIAHPLSEIAYWATCWVAGSKISGWIHDVTVPGVREERQ